MDRVRLIARKSSSAGPYSPCAQKSRATHSLPTRRPAEWQPGFPGCTSKQAVTSLGPAHLPCLSCKGTSHFQVWGAPPVRRAPSSPTSLSTYLSLRLDLSLPLRKWMHLLAAHPLAKAPAYSSSFSDTASTLISLSATSVSVSSAVFSSSSVSLSRSLASSSPIRSHQVQMVP